MPWPGGTCPPGFVADSAADLAPCMPDPSDCPSQQYGAFDLPKGAKAVYLDAATGNDNGDGSAASAVKSFARAIELASKNTVIFVGPGSYEASATVTATLAVVGRCAAQTELHAPKGMTLLRVDGGTQVAQLTLRGVALAGPGQGVLVVQGSAQISRTWIHGVHNAGVIASQPGNSAQLQEVVVAGVQPNDDKSVGIGVTATYGAALVLTDVRLSGNVQSGLSALDPGTTASVARALIDSTLPHAGTGKVGCGISALAGAKVAAQQVRLAKNRQAGLYAAGTGAVISAEQVLIDRTEARQFDQKFGCGVMVAEGGKAYLGGVRASQCRDVGVLVGGASSELHSQGLLVDGTLSAAYDGHEGLGLMMAAGALAEVSSARLSGNRMIGAFAGDDGTRAALTDVLIDGTLPQDQGGDQGNGILCDTGARLQAERVRVTASRAVGVRINSQGTRADLRRLVVDGTLPQQDTGEFGNGLEVATGAHATLWQARLSGNHTTGMLVAGSHSQLAATGVLIDGSQPAGAEIYGGMGAVAQDGGELHIAGSRLLGNAAVGLAGIDAGPLRAVGVWAAGTRVAQNGLLGNGAFVDANAVGRSADQCLGEFISCRLSANYSAAIAAHACSLSVANSVLAATAAATYPVFDDFGTPTGKSVQLGDGLVASHAPQLAIDRVLAAGNPRAGFLLSACGKAVLANSLATGGLYGLVTVGGAAQTAECGFFGSLATRAGDAGLLIPSAPKLSGGGK